jgi:uncharacterized damage-inducible protein DinB
MTGHLGRLLRYDVWANQETLRSLQQGTPPARSVRWMAHIIGAEFLWLARMEQRQASLPVWPDLSVEECEARLRELSRRILDDLVQGPTGPVSRVVSYTNTKGEAWTSTVEEILTHLVIHSAYHRGQIASDVRSAGQEPAYTDYIHAVRQGLIE